MVFFVDKGSISSILENISSSPSAAPQSQQMVKQFSMTASRVFGYSDIIKVFSILYPR